MYLYTIYRCTNSINGKTYIGFDSNWPARMNRHLDIAQNNEGYRLHSAIRKYGADSFIWEPIYQSAYRDHTLNEMEPYFISENDSINNGYNITSGGAGVIGVCENRVWITNGTKSYRIHPNEQIPKGFYPGRSHISRKKKMSDKSKKAISLKNKEHPSLMGGNNPSARKCLIQGIAFETVKSASKTLNIKYGTIMYRCKSESKKFSDWKYI